jgi:hypothetical protein
MSPSALAATKCESDQPQQVEGEASAEQEQNEQQSKNQYHEALSFVDIRPI